MTRRVSARATVYSGVRFRSRFEADVARALDADKVLWEYEAESVSYTTEHLYWPDFTIRTRSGRTILVEAKGYFKPDDRSKLRDVRRAHPDLDLRLLFQRASTKLSRAPNAMTYALWAQTNGFKWAEGVVPEVWLEE